MSAAGYVYDQGWAQERVRLAGIEALWDPGTHALLEELGLGPSWRCLEVGAGGGALVAWLAHRAGHVLATDLDTRFLEPLAGPSVEIRRHDCTRDELPRDAFDLVHARLVLEHLPQRDTVVARLAASLKPGGWLVLEDYDWTAFGFDPADELDDRLAAGILGFMALAGFDRRFGRRLVSSLAAQGLADVRGTGRQLVIGADHPGHAFFALSLQQLGPGAVKAGTLDQPSLDRGVERMQEGTRRIITPVLLAAAGRRPG